MSRRIRDDRGRRPASWPPYVFWLIVMVFTFNLLSVYITGEPMPSVGVVLVELDVKAAFEWLVERLFA